MSARPDSIVRETVAGTSLLRRPGTNQSVPLVLLHGIGGDAATWTRVMLGLDPSIEAIAWDAPGYGTSEPLPMLSPTPADYAAQLEVLIDVLGVRRIVLAGHSLGSLFAGSFAATRSDRLAGLVLMSPALGYRVPAGEALPAAVQGRIDELTRLGAQAFAGKRGPRLIYRPEDKPGVLAGVRRAMAAVNPGGYAQAVRALGAGDLLRNAERIGTPTQVAIGTQDVVTPPANAYAVQAVLPAARPLIEVPDAGHALPQEDPATVAALLGRIMTETGGPHDRRA
jgi:pimeloyl-ACP methyl ester carboxylesterase